MPRETCTLRLASTRFHRQPVFFVGTLLLAGLAVLVVFLQVGTDRPELETRSDYSHIRIRRAGSTRTLLFVRESGREVVESRVDLERPQDLQLAYSKAMFASYLFRPEHKRVLIVGLGGGAMVHFLRHHDPDLQVDVIEIDPVIVELADKYFGVRNEPNVHIVTGDGFEYLRNTPSRYDVIYMDAFLRPSETTDTSGIPTRLKTIEFYRSVREKLTPNGLVVFNLHSAPQVGQDIATIQDALGAVTVFNCPPSRNLVVVATGANSNISERELTRRAAMLDQKFAANFSFQELLDQRTRRWQDSNRRQ